MKLNLRTRIPNAYNQGVMQALFGDIETQSNLLAEGRLQGRHFNASVVPTTGNFAVGDIVWESQPTVMGSVVAGVAADYLRLGWLCTSSGTPGTLKEIRALIGSGTGFPSFSQLTASLGANVLLNNTGSYFDGPSISQGTSGTWFVSGKVTVKDSGSAARMLAKLTDGTSVIDSAEFYTPATDESITVSLSGFLASPAADLRISVLDATSTNGLIVANNSGNGKDSTISAFRLA